MKLFRYLQLLLCLCESVFVNSNYIQQSTEIAQFAKLHSDIITEKNPLLHYQLALGNTQPDKNQQHNPRQQPTKNTPPQLDQHTQIQGPIWKQTNQGIYLEEPRFFEVPVKASIMVAPLQYVPTKHVKQVKSVSDSTNEEPTIITLSPSFVDLNPVIHNIKYLETKDKKQFANPTTTIYTNNKKSPTTSAVKYLDKNRDANLQKTVKYLEISKDKKKITPKLSTKYLETNNNSSVDSNKQSELTNSKKPYQVESEASKNYKHYVNPKDPNFRKVHQDEKREPLIDYTDKKQEIANISKNPEIKKKSKKTKKENYKKKLEAKGSKKLEQVQQSDPEERINVEFQKINLHSDLPREHKKEQQYLLETNDELTTTFKTPIDDEFERLSQENLHFVQANLFGDQPPRPVQINNLKDTEPKQETNKKEVKIHERNNKNEKYKKKFLTKGKDNKSESSGNEEHHSKYDEKYEKNYDDKHEVESTKIKDRSKNEYKGKHKAEDGHKNRHNHEEGHVKKLEESDEGHKHDIFEEKEGHKKGHKTKGYHNKFHKDEVHREHKFYDDDEGVKYHKKKEDTIVNKVVGNDARVLQGIHNRREFIPVYENQNIRNHANLRHFNNNNKNNLVRIKHVNYNNNYKNKNVRLVPLRNPGVRYYSTIHNKNKR